jgi:hypothetical protein
MITPRRPKCLNGARHLFGYPGEPGTSAPTCQRFGCGATNHKYDPTKDTPARLRALADRIESEQCTGLSAFWCPIHGDCACPPGDDLDDDRCPLHNKESSHADQ